MRGCRVVKGASPCRSMPICIVDRRRMRRKLTFWRVAAVAGCIVAVVGVALRSPTISAVMASRAGRLYRPREYSRPDPRQSAARRSARAARQVAGQGRDRARQQPGRHDRRLRTTPRRAAQAGGTQADGRGRRRPCGIRRLYRGDGARDHIVAQSTSLVGSIGVMFQYPNVSELLEDDRRQGRGNQILAAQGGAQRL